MVVLVHHGDALPAYIDATRPLSTPGQAVAERLARAAATRGVRPEVIWHSGKLRTRQTADIFRMACNPAASSHAVRGLLPGDPPMWMRDRLAGESRQIMVVGHMPHLPDLLALLTAAQDPQGLREFPLNGVVAIEADGARWKEIWRLEGPAFS